MDTPDNAACRAWIAATTNVVTSRLVLRPLTRADSAAFYVAMQNPRVNKWMGSFPQPFTLDGAHDWLDSRVRRHEVGEAIYFGIYYPDADDVLGFFGVRATPEYGMPELAWALCEKYWGKRIIDEVGTALIDSLARAGITQVCATAALHNESSARVMQVLGLEKHSECDFFRPDGTVRPSHFYVRKI